MTTENRYEIRHNAATVAADLTLYEACKVALAVDANETTVIRSEGRPVAFPCLWSGGIRPMRGAHDMEREVVAEFYEER